MRIKSLIWEYQKWSWGLTYKELHDALPSDWEVMFVNFTSIKNQNKLIDSRNCDLIFCQNITQVSRIKNYKVPIVSRLGGVMNFEGVPMKQVNIYKEQMKKCGAIIATNYKLYNIAKSVNPNSYLIPNGIDLEKWVPSPTRKWNTEKPIIGFVGNILTPAKISYKGYDLLRRACAQLKLQVFEATYKTKQIPHNKMMKNFYYKIDILVHPTKGEGCSNTILEALACGVPVITTRTAGFHGEMLEDGKNVIFCDRTVTSIIKAIQQFQNNPALYQKLSSKGREFAKKHHNIKIIAQKYKKIFERVLSN